MGLRGTLCILFLVMLCRRSMVIKQMWCLRLALYLGSCCYVHYIQLLCLMASCCYPLLCCSLIGIPLCSVSCYAWRGVHCILLLVMLQRGSIMIVRQLVCPTIVFNHIVFSSLLLTILDWYALSCVHYSWSVIFMSHRGLHYTVTCFALWGVHYVQSFCVMYMFHYAQSYVLPWHMMDSCKLRQWDGDWRDFDIQIWLVVLQVWMMVQQQLLWWTHQRPKREM